ncbi:glycosyltransferase, partial [bacterium]|nr:glycosyltransferase [bacterium]
MNNSLCKQFSEFLSSENFDAANQIIKQARSLKYPHVLINFWENSLAYLESGARHPLDSTTEPNQDTNNLCVQLNKDLKEEFQLNLANYCSLNNIDKNQVGKVTKQIFESYDQENETIMLPDLTSNEPDCNLLHFSIRQYSIDNPDVSGAVKRGIFPSVIDHFLRHGYFEILKGLRYSPLCFSHERIKYNGKLLYIVDDYNKLLLEQRSRLNSLQLGRFAGDIFSVKHNSVFTSSGSCLDIEIYLFQNISEHHNLCILLPNKILSDAAIKWILDIKLKDKTAIFGFSKSNGSFCSVTEFSNVNMLASDITNGCIVVNSIDALSVATNVKDYESAYGYYHALVLQLHQIGVDFCLKKEILSQNINDGTIKMGHSHNACWSPFFWTISSSNSNKSLLTTIRRDLVRTWSNQLSLCDSDDDLSNDGSTLRIDPEKSIVQFKPCSEYKIAIIVPFRDQIHLLANCVDSLMLRKEEIGFVIYAINNDSCEPETFDTLDLLKDKYQDRFVCINSPGEFNYAKINNEAVDQVAEDYILFLNNDILVESNFAITTLLKTHLFYDAIVTGSKLLYPSGKIQHNGIATTQEKHIAVNCPFRGQQTKLNHELLSEADIHPWDRTHECSAVTAACMLMQKDDFLGVGGFNEEFKVAYNDVDLCFRAKDKYDTKPIVCSTDLKIFHLESESRGLDADEYKTARLYHERVKLVNSHEKLFSQPDKFTGISSSYEEVHKVIKTNFDRKYIDASSPATPKSDINLEELAFHQSHNRITKKYACVFVQYDKDSLIPADCVHHLLKLSEYCDIFFVSSSESLATSPKEIAKIKPYCKQILIRKNSGYDFGCWSHAIRKNYSQLCDYEGVLLANDSNWGPLHDFSDTFSKINNFLADVDFLGLTS